ncbi:LAFE_0F04808g1_1 [Lachancea fermentati]|uniref:LAFE_0F04808g1_1 n=1 Tax=Lachancea fermentati TaxID=4955 RepID=A0A1G4MF39_LACFM|nr:LAFE_0F04808g1_1 [Lachancea fermentati]
MLETPPLPLVIPSENGLPPDLCVLRQGAVLAGRDSTDTSLATKLDASMAYADALLAYYYSTAQDAVLEEHITVAMVNAAYFYQQLSQEMLQTAYVQGSKEAWAASGLYNKRCIGLLQFLVRSQIPRTTQLLSTVQMYMRCWALSQQLGVVILSLSKLKSQVCGGTGTGTGGTAEKYERLLEFQESDLKELSKSSVLYARLCIGCRDMCSQLANTELATASQYLARYLDTLTYTLLSLDAYKEGQCGLALGMLAAAIDSLSQGLVTRKQLKLIQDNVKLKDRLTSKIKEMKIEGKQLRSKFKKSKSPSASADLGGIYNKNALHPFLQSTLIDFIIPLIMLLQYRYQITNDKLFYQPVVKDSQELSKHRPQGKAPDANGIDWNFDGQHLTEASGGKIDYF